MVSLRRFSTVCLVGAALLAGCGDDEPRSSGSPSSTGSGASGASGGSGGTGAVGGMAGGEAGAPNGGGGSGPGDILDELQMLEGVTAVEVPSEIDGYRYFSIEIEQPADHFAPDGQTFKQRMTLLHKDYGAPLVL